MARLSHSFTCTKAIEKSDCLKTVALRLLLSSQPGIFAGGLFIHLDP